MKLVYRHSITTKKENITKFGVAAFLNTTSVLLGTAITFTHCTVHINEVNLSILCCLQGKQCQELVSKRSKSGYCSSHRTVVRITKQGMILLQPDLQCTEQSFYG